MEHGNNIDMMTLSWFVPEIRESLQHVAHALDELRANPHGQDAIKRARLHLHQTHGALQVAGISGVALLTEEAEHVISAFEDGVLEADESSIDVLKMVMRAITEYLEDMQASGTSIPVLVLYPYYRDLVGLRKAVQPDPAALFDVDLDRALPASVRAMISDAPDREERAKSAARGFERALPALIRGENVVAAIDGLHEAMGRMLRNQPHVGARLFYWLSYALLDGLKHGALKVDLATRRAVGRINIQNRHLFTGQSDVPPQFIKELLIILAQAGSGSAVVEEVKRHFHLASLVPADYERRRYGLADPETIRIAREALVLVHRTWEKLAGGTQAEEPAFVEAVGHLNQALAKTHYAGLGMLGKTLATMPAALAGQQGRTREMLAIEVATAVLFMEEALAGALRSNPAYDDRAQELAARISSLLANPDAFDPTPLPWLVALSNQASERMTQAAFVNELKHNLSTCEQALDDYFRDETAVNRLETVEPLLAETSAVLTVLEYGDAAQACRAISKQVDDIIRARVTLNDAGRARLADGLSSVGFFVETMLQSASRARRFRFDAQRGMLFEDTSIPETPEEVVSDADSNALLRSFADEASAGAEQAADASHEAVPEAAVAAAGLTAAAGLAAAQGAAEAPASKDHDGAGDALAFELPSQPVVEAAMQPAADEGLAFTAPESVQADVAPEAAEPALPEGVLEDGTVELSADEAELHEIFLLEAAEVLDAIDENLGVVRKAPDDREAMTTIRRGFHTLKGSSRMVGLDAFGEAAWAFEQMMNHWLSEDKDGTTPLFELIQDGANFFRSWCEQLQAAPRRVLDASLLTARCNAFPDKPAAVPAVKPAAPAAAQPAVQAASMPVAQAAAPSVAQPVAKPVAPPAPVAVQPVEEAETLPVLDLEGEADTLPMPEMHAPELPTLEVPSLDDALSASALPASRADGFSQSHNFASVSRSMPEGDLRQSLEGFLDDASHRQADMPVADLASLHSDPVRPADSLRDEDFGSQQDDLLGNGAFEAQDEDESSSEQADLDAWSNAMAGESADFDSLLGELPNGDELALNNVEAADLDLADAFMVPADLGEDDDIPLLDMGSALPAEKPVEKPVEAAPVSHDPFDFSAASLGVETKSFAAEVPSEPSQEDTLDFGAFKFDDEPVSGSVQPDHEVKPVAETPAPAAPVAAQPAPVASVVPEVPVAPSEPAPVAKVAQPEPQESMVRIGERLVDAELFEIFNAEATQARMRMNEDWQDWHASDALRAPEPLIRALHTLVGTSRHVGLVQVRGIAAAMEKLLVKQREVAKPLPDGMKASMQAALGVIDRMLGEFASRIEPAADPETTARMEALLANWDVEINADSQPPKPVVESKSGREMRGEDLLKKAAEVLGAARRETEEKSDPLAGLVDEIDPDLGPVFFEEAEELMPQVDNNLREWRERPADGSVPGALMRLFHTIKGSARMAGAMRFGQMIHELETQVEDALAQPPVQPSVIEAVLAGYDQAVSAYEVMLHPELAEQRAAETKALQQTCAAQAAQAAKAQETAPEAAAPQAQPAAVPLPQCEALARQQAAQAAAQAAADGHAHDAAKAGGALLDPSMGGAANPAAAAQHVIRVRADLLDRMVAEAGEVAIARARLDSEMGLIRGAINELTENVNRLRLQLREIEIQADNQIQAKIAHSNETETEFDPLEFDRYTRFQEVTRMLAESVNDVSTVQQNALRALDAAMQDLARQGQVSRSLQQSLMRVRMVQFSTINDRLYRVVRQAGKDTDKRVTLEIKGGQAEIDRNVLDRMAGPIEHILRNSVAHGIEERAKRAASGKPDIGELTIEVSQDGNEVIMRFLDDGQGLDYPRIEARARERGLIAPDHQPSERELAQMIFAPGFSTAKQVTALAGRGVGMDVVRAEVAGLGGRIDVDSTTGKGSCFTVHLPVSLAVTQVVLLEIEGGKFAVQSALVEQIVQMKPEALTEAYQAQRLEVAGERVPFYFLGSLLEIPGVKPVAQRVAPVVVLRAGATRIALHVDTVVPNQEVVIKHIGPQLARLAGVAGATVLGNGDIVLILNPVQLAMARVAGQLGKGKAATFSASELQTAATVMVVDDSVTVRKVTQRLLMREGYNVVLAKDGVDALRQMQEVIPDVMLVDIEMPRMDGFDLTKNVREHADFANVPIIMITSRTADKHRNHALSLGVDVFLGKPFSEDDLLRHVRSFASQRAPRAMTN